MLESFVFISKAFPLYIAMSQCSVLLNSFVCVFISFSALSGKQGFTCSVAIWALVHILCKHDWLCQCLCQGQYTCVQPTCLCDVKAHIFICSSMLWLVDMCPEGVFACVCGRCWSFLLSLVASPQHCLLDYSHIEVFCPFWRLQINSVIFLFILFYCILFYVHLILFFLSKATLS